MKPTKKITESVLKTQPKRTGPPSAVPKEKVETPKLNPVTLLDVTSAMVPETTDESVPGTIRACESPFKPNSPRIKS